MIGNYFALCLIAFLPVGLISNEPTNSEDHVVEIKNKTREAGEVEIKLNCPSFKQLEDGVECTMGLTKFEFILYPRSKNPEVFLTAKTKSVEFISKEKAKCTGKKCQVFYEFDTNTNSNHPIIGSESKYIFQDTSIGKLSTSYSNASLGYYISIDTTISRYGI